MDYFKHYSTASDSKSMNLIFDEFGHKGIAFYWLLVELCAENWDGVSEPEFNFHQRTVVTKLKSSLNSVRTWLQLSSDSGLCAFAQNGTQFEIKMPKLREIKETRGRIKGNKPEKFDILEEEKEEEKEEDKDNNKAPASLNPAKFNPAKFLDAKKILPELSPQENLKKQSPLSFLFHHRPDIQEWLDKGNHDTHLVIVKKQKSHHELAELIEKAFGWAQDKNLRAETWLLTFVDNKKTAGFGAGFGQKSFSGPTPVPELTKQEIELLKAAGQI